MIEIFGMSEYCLLFFYVCLFLKVMFLGWCVGFVIKWEFREKIIFLVFEMSVKIILKGSYFSVECV